jgi:hypothetical protein
MAHTSSKSNPFLSTSSSSPFGADLAFKSPFATVAEETETAKAQGFAMVSRGPAVEASEVEEVGSVAVEILISWGGTVLSTQHLSPARSFFVGEEESKHVHCDFLVPAERLGATRAPLVLVSGGVAYAVLLPGATGTLQMAGRPEMSVSDAIADGVAEACVEMAGAHRVALAFGTRVRIQLGDLTFSTGAVPAGKRIAPALIGAASLTGLCFVGLSFLAHAVMLGGMAFFKPSLDAADDDESRKEHEVLMQQMLRASAEREDDLKKDEAKKDDGPSGGTGAAAAGEAGSMGKSDSPKTDGRYTVKGPKNNPEPNLSRDAQRAEAASFGIIAELRGIGDPLAVTSPWAQLAQGKDETSTRGAMWGSTIDDNQGAGGLGLFGVGEGGGSKYGGIGLGAVGTIGGGKGLEDGQGLGARNGKNLADHVAKPPSVRIAGPTVVSGRIPGEVIQRIVRQGFGRYRHCYETGLRNNPTLSGRVAVRFVIDRNGAVASAGNGGSDLPDSAVVRCVVGAFTGLSFPAPEGGIVTVTYPIQFTPGS